MMTLSKRWLTTGAELIFVLVNVLAVLIPASPRLQPLPSWDSGVFLYTGWRVTQGALPYRDVWDHKPPLIYLVNAVGILLSNTSRWGVWGLEVVFLFAAGLIGYDLLKRTFGTWCAVFISFAWLLNAFFTMDGGNYTTEYALPFQFGLLWLIATASEGKISTRRALVIGIFSAVLFWFKQNLIAIPLAIGIYWLILVLTSREKRAYLRSLLAMSAGAILFSLLVLSPFVLNGALAEFWDAVFWFNSIYVDEPWLKRVLALREIGFTINAAGFSLLAAMGWLGASIVAFDALHVGEGSRAWGLPGGSRARWTQSLDALLGEPPSPGERGLAHVQRATLLSVTLIAFPLEIFWVAYPGKQFDHYFLALLPTGAVLAAFAFRTLLNALERVWTARRATALFCCVTIVLAGYYSAYAYTQKSSQIGNRGSTAVAAYIDEHSQPEDAVFIWGSEGRTLFAAQRHNPTPYIYLAAFNHVGYTTDERISNFLTALEQAAPPLMLDTTANPNGFFHFNLASPATQQQAQSFVAKYRVQGMVSGWTVYIRRRGAN